ncbi:HMG (high mobility group) box domain-containing protein [Ditylenchus destructor]|nr:HMG (high mobility group) box domain-containing protein [Ditylenchus destructor]
MSFGGQTTYIVNAPAGAFIPAPHHAVAAPSHQIRAQPAQHHHTGEHNKPMVRGKTSPYGFFVKMCYEEHKKKYPNENVQVTEISKKCSQKWKTMSDDEKKRFFELAQKDAERYQAEVAAYGGEDLMRKKKRAKKDPNAPKRALSAFFFFSNERRVDVQKEHPEWKVGQIAQELGRCWKGLTEEEKSVYEKKATEDKERYSLEMQQYKNVTGNISGTCPNPSSQSSAAVKMEQTPTCSQPVQIQSQHPQQQQSMQCTPQMVILQQQQPGQLPMQILEDHPVSMGNNAV